MYLIDETYFRRELQVPGTQEIRSEVISELEMFIDEKAREILKRSLGNVLFADFDQYVDADGTLNSSAPQKWQNLVNGSTYTFAGTEYAWQGLTFTEGAYKVSLLAYYTFYHWLRNHTTSVGTIGEYRGEAKNVRQVSSSYRASRVYNKFVRMYQGRYRYQRYYGDAFGYYNNASPTTIISTEQGLRIIGYYGLDDLRDGFVSLITFLLQNDDDYPDAALRLYDLINEFGI